MVALNQIEKTKFGSTGELNPQRIEFCKGSLDHNVIQSILRNNIQNGSESILPVQN